MSARPIARLAVLALLVAALAAGATSCDGAGASAGAAPARQPLLVSDISAISGMDQITFTALQGLVNRSGPALYLDGFPDNQGNPNTAASREILTRLVDLPKTTVAPYQLFTRFRSRIRGLVVWDPAMVVDTENVATSLAGSDDALPVSPAMARRLEAAPYRFPVLLDLRDEHFTSRAQVYSWALHHSGGAGRYAVPVWIGDNDGNARGNEPWLRDWVVQHHGFAFEADPETQSAVVDMVLGAFPTDSPVYGYIFYANASEKAGGVDLEEPVGVGEISQAGDYLIPTITATNLSVLSQLKAAVPHPRWDARPARPVADRVYVAFAISDGDNIGSDETELLVNQWRSPDRGKIPMGVSVSAQLARLAPTLYAHLVDTMTPDDVLIAAPSGAGYAYPSEMPDLDRYLVQSRALMRRAGLSAVWILDNNYLNSPTAATVDRYAQILHPPAVFADYDDLQGDYKVPNPPAISFAGSTPVVHDVWATSTAATVAAIRDTAAAAHGRPAFVFVGLNIWTMGYPQAMAIMKALGPGYTSVRPDHFMGLVAGARAAGLLASGQTAG